MKVAMWALWATAVGLGLLAMAMFVQGVLRDRHVGDPALTVRLDEPSGWSRETFRVWGEKPYRLHLASVNHTPPFGVPYGGSLEVRLLTPSGDPAFQRVYEGDSIRHERPSNMHWSNLASFELRGRPWETWTLEARTVRPDTAFGDVHSYLTLRRIRDDPGMGGLMNYVMPIPGIFFLLISLLPATALSRRGAAAPLRGSATILVLVLLLLFIGPALLR